MKIIIWVAIAMSLFSGGCFMSSYQSVDYGKNSRGEVYIKDTPHTWSEMKSILDDHISDEIDARKPQGGHANWSLFWINSFRVWRSGGLENPEKYVHYVEERRREYGLPEIN